MSNAPLLSFWTHHRNSIRCNWIALNAPDEKHGVLFVHHPVCPLGDGFMSRSQALDNLNEANRVVGDSQIDSRVLWTFSQ